MKKVQMYKKTLEFQYKEIQLQKYLNKSSRYNNNSFYSSSIID